VPDHARTGAHSDSPGALRIEADLGHLAEVRAFVRGTAARLGADDQAVGDLVQAVDEWVTNVVRHGYRGGHGPLEIELGRAGSEIVVRVRDRAPVFDPADAPSFDPELPLHRRRPGGMGIHLMRELTGPIGHRPLPGGGNEITLRRDVRSTNVGGSHEHHG
jgi:anti-sigma regulatory factor (Ser/Thr protein kinase)